jgi:hypothetical protein
MHVDALRFGLAPDRLEIHEVRLTGLDGKLTIFKDKSVSVAKLMKPGEDPGPVAFDQAKTQRMLETLLTERGGAKALEEFQTGFETAAGKKADRANRVPALVGRGSGDRGFYEALFRKLVETTPLAEAEVTSFAQRRGEAPARVEVGDTQAAG